MARVAKSIYSAVAAAVTLAGLSAAADPSDADVERAVAAAVNRHREERGLEPLGWSDAAAELARQHSGDMAAGRGGFGPDGFEQREGVLRSQARAPRSAGHGAHHSAQPPSGPDATVAGWIASPAHRRNLEGPYQLAGVGASRGADGSVYLTEIFFGTAPAPRAPMTL